MDAELRELERLFQAAQEVKSTSRLSERSVVELVVKLQQLELLDADLLHTTSGKEYVTQECLRREMEAEIKRLGRVSLIELSSTIGVDLYHCEKQAEHIVTTSPEVSMVQGEIITDGYWDGLAEEVNETLREASHVSLGELARRFNLGSELLTGILTSRIGTIVHGKLEGGQLYTPEYVSRVKAAVRGAVRALMVPTTLQGVWNSVQLQLRSDGEGVASEGGIFLMVLNELVGEGAVKGSVRGSGTTWTPAVFAQSQRESVEAFYSQNGFISYDVLKKLQIAQPKQYLEAKYPDGIALETVFVHTSSVDLMDSPAEEAISGGGWFDALETVPPAFSSSDAANLLRLCPSVQAAVKDSAAIYVTETCIVSDVFTKNILEKLQSWVQEIPAKTGTQNGAADNKSKAKAGKNEKNQKESDDEDDYNNGRSGKNKKKGGKGKATKKAPTPSAASKAAASDEPSIPSEDQLAEKIVEWFPDIETAGSENGYTGALAMCLAIHLRPQIVARMISLKQASQQAKHEDRRKRLEALQIKVNQDRAHLLLFFKAIEMFRNEMTLEVILERHLLRTMATEIADALLEAQVTDESSEGQELPAKPFTSSMRMTLAKGLPPSSMAVEMVESLEGKSVLEFDSTLEVVARECGLRLKKLDKKSEKALFQSYRKNLLEQVVQETDPIALLPKIVALLYAQIHGHALQAPGRIISSAVARLKESMEYDVYTVLESYHSATVTFLASQATKADADAIRSKRDILEASMQQLKDIVPRVSASSTK